MNIQNRYTKSYSDTTFYFKLGDEFLSSRYNNIIKLITN